MQIIRTLLGIAGAEISTLKKFTQGRGLILRSSLSSAIFSIFLIRCNLFGADTAPPSPDRAWSPPGLERVMHF